MGNDALWSILMTALAAVAGILAAVFPAAREWLLLLAGLFFLVAAACAYRLIANKLRTRRTVKPDNPEERFSRFIGDGITGELVETNVVNDHAEGTLRIHPTNTNIELPQPLELLIISTDIEDVLGVKHYPSETNDADVGYPDPRGYLFIRLRAPRLYGAGHLDIRLRSKGPSLSVQGVKRNPAPVPLWGHPLVFFRIRPLAGRKQGRRR